MGSSFYKIHHSSNCLEIPGRAGGTSRCLLNGILFPGKICMMETAVLKMTLCKYANSIVLDDGCMFFLKSCGLVLNPIVCLFSSPGLVTQLLNEALLKCMLSKIFFLCLNHFKRIRLSPLGIDFFLSHYFRLLVYYNQHRYTWVTKNV